MEEAGGVEGKEEKSRKRWSGHVGQCVDLYLLWLRAGSFPRDRLLIALRLIQISTYPTVVVLKPWLIPTSHHNRPAESIATHFTMNQVAIVTWLVQKTQ